MNADYESVRWFTEFFYNASRISDNVLIIAVAVALWLGALYSIVCILLSPTVMLHRGIADFRKGRFSIYEVIASGLRSYPGLLPWSRSRIQQPIIYYIIVHGYWIVVFGISSFAGFGEIHSGYIEEGVYDPDDMIKVIILVIFTNITWMYSIMLLVWNRRLELRLSGDTQNNKHKMFSIHPSVIISVWLTPMVLHFIDIFLRLIMPYDPNRINESVLWWGYLIEILYRLKLLYLLYPYLDPMETAMIYVIILWILGSCAWMVTKEILIQRMGSGAFAQGG